MQNTCPFPDRGKNVDIIEPFPTTNQESPISALSNMMSEKFILSYGWGESRIQDFNKPEVF